VMVQLPLHIMANMMDMEIAFCHKYDNNIIINIK
jgi:hypothetical protein